MRRPATVAFSFGEHVEDHVQQLELRELRAMFAAGDSYSQIAAFMYGKGKTPSRGKLWYSSSVRAVLMSKMTKETA